MRNVLIPTLMVFYSKLTPRHCSSMVVVNFVVEGSMGNEWPNSEKSDECSVSEWVKDEKSGK